MILELHGISTGYGGTPVVHDIDLTVQAGEIVTLVGANGAGKTTLVKTISGLLRAQRGQILFEGRRIDALSSRARVLLGIAHVPEGRQVFPELTVKENLEIGAYIPSAKAARAQTLDLVFAIFPALSERRKQLAGTMSGGEQQMLAVGRGLMLRPHLLMLD